VSASALPSADNVSTTLPFTTMSTVFEAAATPGRGE